MFAISLVILVTVIHVAIAVTEMFFWRLPKVHERLGYNIDDAKKVAPIVANAGLYNGFLAAGLIWGLSSWGGSQTLLFFLTCVIVAGVFGAMTLRWSTLVLQSLPGVLAWGAVWMSK